MPRRTPEQKKRYDPGMESQVLHISEADLANNAPSILVRRSESERVSGDSQRHRPADPNSHSAVWRLRSRGRLPWVAGLPERSFGSPFKVQGKSQRVLEPLHYLSGNPANLAFKTHGGQRS
jgi:hypothetical protein